MKALAEMTGAAGLTDPSNFLPRHFMMRENSGEMTTGDEVYPYLPMGFLIDGKADDLGLSGALEPGAGGQASPRSIDFD